MEQRKNLIKRAAVEALGENKMIRRGRGLKIFTQKLEDAIRVEVTHAANILTIQPKKINKFIMYKES